MAQQKGIKGLFESLAAKLGGNVDGKSVGRVAVAGGLFVLMVVIVLVGRTRGGSEDAGEPSRPEPGIEYHVPDIPMGEDREDLSRGERDLVYRGTVEKGGLGAEDLFAQTQDGASDDPLSELMSGGGRAEDSDGASAQADRFLKDLSSGDPMEKVLGGRRNVYGEMEDAAAQERAARIEERRRREREAEESRQRALEEARREVSSRGDDRRPQDQISSSSSSSYTASASTPPSSGGQSATSQPESQQPSQPAEPEKPRVRRSGGVSSFGGVKGVGSGVSSLDNEALYVTDDPTHLFKVKFVYDEKITSGQRVTLRLCEDMSVDGVLIPKNTHLFATCSVGERLTMEVQSIDLGGKIYQLGYEAYDADGGLGLYCPTSEGQTNAQEAVEQAQSMGESILSSGIVGTAGRIVSAGSQMLRRTVRGKQQAVEVTAGYTFYLMSKEGRNR